MILIKFQVLSSLDHKKKKQTLLIPSHYLPKENRDNVLKNILIVLNNVDDDQISSEVMSSRDVAF